MEFNSLDAQRESCEAFVASQKAEGWLLVPDRYDDGGFSGGSLSDRHCSGFSPTSSGGGWTWWSSTRSTASAAP